MSHILADSQGSKHIGGLQGLTGTGRSRANCILLHGHQQALSLYKSKGHVDVAVVSVMLTAVQFNMSHFFSDSLDDLVVEVLDVLGVVLHLLPGHLASLSHTNNNRSRQSSRP